MQNVQKLCKLLRERIYRKVYIKNAHSAQIKFLLDIINVLVDDFGLKEVDSSS